MNRGGQLWWSMSRIWKIYWAINIDFLGRIMNKTEQKHRNYRKTTGFKNYFESRFRFVPQVVPQIGQTLKIHCYRVPPKKTQWALFKFVCEKLLIAKHLVTSRRRIRIILPEFLSGDHGSPERILANNKICLWLQSIKRSRFLVPNSKSFQDFQFVKIPLNCRFY